jgi:hypothetical protein
MTLYDIPKSFFWQKLFVWPLISITFFIIMLIVDIVLIIRLLKKRKSPKIIGCILSIVFIFSFLILFGQFFRYGLLLTLDKDEPIMLTGNVEVIVEMPQVIRFGSNDDGSLRRAYQITVNGISFFCLNADHISIGDQITIKYLSKSKIILLCEF